LRIKTVKRAKAGIIDTEQIQKSAPYVAGLLDGEGTFSLKKVANKIRFVPIISLSMTHEPTIEFVAYVLKVTYQKRERQKPYKDNYVLRVTTRADVKRILEELKPFSITKKAHIELVLKFISLEEKSVQPKNAEQYHKLIDLYIELRKLNHRGKPIDYDSMRRRLHEALR
jgi:hypothetical protein